MKEKCEKISNIEVVEGLKYLGVIEEAKRNVFEGEKKEMTKKKKKKKIKRLSVMTNSVIEKKLPSSNDGETYWKRSSGATKCAVWSRSNRHERRRNRQITKSRDHCNEKNLENIKGGPHRQQ